MKFVIRREEIPRATKFEVEAEDYDAAIELIEDGSPEIVEVPYWDADHEMEYTYTDVTSESKDRQTLTGKAPGVGLGCNVYGCDCPPENPRPQAWNETWQVWEH